MTAARSYRVEHHIDHHPGSRLHWRLYTYGAGQWCVGQGHAGSFANEVEAETAGIGWVRTGLPPCEQTAIRLGREHIAKLAEADGHSIFAQEVRAGCWDDRSDVAAAIALLQI